MRHSPQGPGEMSGKLSMVFATGNIPEGMLVKGMLEAEGIPVVIKGESEGPYRVGPVYVWVPEEFEVHARMALEDAASAGTGEDDLEGSDREKRGPEA